ncbi:hypothetical protein BB737_00205 [Mycobacterium avium subsp. hominissuis]|uniref:Uncharacterized protein n=5 Tax=Mycobacterium TaxID=1763 RepID=A0ABX3TDS3_9MYCO|nr:hypothetical protein BST19_22640 [Mycobacterium bouchedurhonense]ORB76958.1 hypothetical protein BST46_27185 [Mycobacterium timonense]PBJ35988.1 hypothetical protein XV03_10425 [Mycobacterium avium subsp. hominissuis]PBJ67788.1 hypothetical protein BB737_00205 [Mycobacterium avium subsp. hominissuis]
MDPPKAIEGVVGVMADQMKILAASQRLLERLDQAPAIPGAQPAEDIRAQRDELLRQFVEEALVHHVAALRVAIELRNTDDARKPNGTDAFEAEVWNNKYHAYVDEMSLGPRSPGASAT